MRALGFLEAYDDRMIERLAQPAWHALAQNPRRAFAQRAAFALPGHNQDKPRPLSLRLRQEHPQCDESLLPPHAMEVDHGFRRGAAARKLLAQPPLQRC
jgi:hypothetical protein